MIEISKRDSIILMIYVTIFAIGVLKKAQLV